MTTKAPSGVGRADTENARGGDGAPQGAAPRTQAPAAGDWAVCCSEGGIRSVAPHLVWSAASPAVVQELEEIAAATRSVSA